ncbi:hypothetical protein CDL12_23712 [Handroanthus impetiginosus]|uniref:Uncharacterized protein n=1 Tax=Handroanthus impetiginosus TaxID=429701 RepID=A0A2G9GFH9_9LAMI|nr:hypothetical protein CDL12_23712 [Handroanthus impetiginosus]
MHLTLSQFRNKVDRVENMVLDSHKECDPKLGKKVNRIRKHKVGPSNQMSDLENRPSDALKMTTHLTRSCRKSANEFEVENEKGSPDWVKLNGVEKPKIGPPNQTSVVDNQREHDQQSNALKKLDLVENMEDYSPIDLESYPEYVDLEDDQGGYMDEGKTVANDEKKKEHEDDTDSDVEILDSEAITKKAILGSFVPSKRFHYSMQEDLGRSSTGGEFRKQVLDVLRKPFDKEEYTRHQEAAKSYLDHHPDFHRKLKKYRYNQQKRLIIYRGFFFWLQVSVYMSFVCFRFPFNSLLSFA